MTSRTLAGDTSRRRRSASEARRQWYAYWRTLRHSRRLFGNIVIILPFTLNK